MLYWITYIWLARGTERLKWFLYPNHHLSLKSLMLPCFKVFILIRKRVYCCKIHIHMYFTTIHVDIHTGDLRVGLYQQLIDQCEGLLILMRLGVLPLWCFSLLIAGKYILIGLGPPEPEMSRQYVVYSHIPMHALTYIYNCVKIYHSQKKEMIHRPEICASKPVIYLWCFLFLVPCIILQWHFCWIWGWSCQMLVSDRLR